MYKKISLSLILFAAIISTVYSQVRRDSADFIIMKNEFWNEMLKEMDAFKSEPVKEKKSFKMDFTGYDIPTSPAQFTKYRFNEPVSQGYTGTCWSFSTTSLLESEVYRIHNKKIKLSEMHTAYWEYIEKAKGYVRARGNQSFGEGSQANAVLRIWKQYGAVPEEVYNGMLPGQKHHDHRVMFEEMNNFLKGLKTSNIWNEEFAAKTIKSILNKYLGEPPASFTYNGKEYTPKEFLEKEIQINPDDYVDIISLMQEDYWKQIEYPVPDNWWHNKDYYNVPLDIYMDLIKKSISNGYTICIGGDVSEAGYDSRNQVAMVPTFDIPSDYIDQYARQFRFTNGTTGDDHGLHLVGYMVKDGKYWFLIKDSGAGSRASGNNPGFYYYHEDYIKLKMLTFMVHKDAVIDVLEKFKK